jgi:AraC-like DNA-binding protein
MVHSLCSSVCADLTVQCMSVRAPQVALARPVKPAELVKCVREILRRELGRICVAADIARRLEMDRRSLQRHLRSEGTTFREISREMQFQASQRLLASGASVSDVAKALGFSELSAFTHAFRRCLTIRMAWRWAASQFASSTPSQSRISSLSCDRKSK